MRRLGALVIATALAGAAWAQTSDRGGGRSSDSTRGSTSAATVSGGIGVSARENMRTQTPLNNVKMVFSLHTGNYLCDVQVKVTDSAGKTVVEEVSDRPWLYAQLP